MALILFYALESLAGFVNSLLGLISRVSNVVAQDGDLKIYISNKLRNDSEIVSLWACFD